LPWLARTVSKFTTQGEREVIEVEDEPNFPVRAYVTDHNFFSDLSGEKVVRFAVL